MKERVIRGLVLVLKAACLFFIAFAVFGILASVFGLRKPEASGERAVLGVFLYVGIGIACWIASWATARGAGLEVASKANTQIALARGFLLGGIVVCAPLAISCAGSAVAFLWMGLTDPDSITNERRMPFYLLIIGVLTAAVLFSVITVAFVRFYRQLGQLSEAATIANPPDHRS